MIFLILDYLLIVTPKIEILVFWNTSFNFAERKLATNFPCKSDERVKVKQNLHKS